MIHAGAQLGSSFPPFYSAQDPSPWDGTSDTWHGSSQLSLASPEMPSQTWPRCVSSMSLKPVSLTLKMDHRRSRLKLDLRVLQYSDAKLTGAPEVTEMKVNRQK